MLTMPQPRFGIHWIIHMTAHFHTSSGCIEHFTRVEEGSIFIISFRVLFTQKAVHTPYKTSSLYTASASLKYRQRSQWL